MPLAPGAPASMLAPPVVAPHDTGPYTFTTGFAPALSTTAPCPFRYCQRRGMTRPSLNAAGGGAYGESRPPNTSWPRFSSTCPSQLSSSPLAISAALCPICGLSGAQSVASGSPSPSSSVSALLPTPSWSVSTDSDASSGKASLPSATPSLSSSASDALPMWSWSVSSWLALARDTQLSTPSITPSSSASGSSGAGSAPSASPSPSSSVSALLPMPSPSVSSDSDGSSGKASFASETPSLSSSVSHASPV